MCSDVLKYLFKWFISQPFLWKCIGLRELFSATLILTTLTRLQPHVSMLLQVKDKSLPSNTAD